MKSFIGRVAGGETLDREMAAQAFDIMMSGDATPSQIGGFLMSLRVRGETVDEITGAVTTMRAKMLRVEAPPEAIDIVGTGGDASGTYNISTASAFVVAGAGVPVAKHGNRALSSRSGAADVLMALGVNIEVGPAVIAKAIREAGVGFMFAPAHHSAMKHVGSSRVELGTRTIFNLLGPLSNPAGTRRQLVGVFSPDWVAPLAEVLRNLGAERVWVVHGDGLDEMTTTGATMVASLADGEIDTFEVTPDEVGLTRVDRSALIGGEAEENAAALTALLAGEHGPYREIVLLNAGGSLVVAGRANTLADGIGMAAESIDSGAAKSRLDKLVAVTGG